MLSRLKGIETILFFLQYSISSAFVYAFPFEGNWNKYPDISANTSSIDFVYGFPFEGNWNEWFKSPTSKVDETLLCICFPVWRELKPWHLQPLGYLSRGALYMLSRLKGIETQLQSRISGLVDDYFVYAFPFEGNWNFEGVPKLTSALTLCICFPVWRELKHKKLIWEPWLPFFVYGFPFEGNWNTSFGSWSKGTVSFVYGFPFEGNWNSMAG